MLQPLSARALQLEVFCFYDGGKKGHFIYPCRNGDSVCARPNLGFTSFV
uniref:Uncharacterized protein n=1 Tax=Anguilla anguilla TaxID=7936 RepID=A0A0E9X1C1_ANGAN